MGTVMKLLLLGALAAFLVSAQVTSVPSSTSGGTGDVAGPAASVDGEAVRFDGTTGKLLKRSTLNGIVKETSGVPSAATAGTDYMGLSSTNAPTGRQDFGGASAFELPNGTTPPGTCNVGEQFFDTDAPIGSQVLVCRTANTWTPIRQYGSFTVAAGYSGATTILTTANNPVVTFVIPGGTLAVGDSINCNWTISSSGTTDTPRSSITFGATSATLLSHSAADSGALVYYRVAVSGASAQRVRGQANRFVNGGWSNTAVATPAEAISGNITVTLNAWFNARTVDTLTFEDYACVVSPAR